MNVFLDCGTNLGQGLSTIMSNHAMDSSWKIISYEANSCTYDSINKSKFSFVDFLNLGVWIDDSIRDIDA